MKWLKWLRRWAERLKCDVVALWIAAHDPRTALVAKLVAVAVAAYALSPIDLIPDFVPVLGYLDDLIVVPLGVSLALRLIPPDSMLLFRQEASKRLDRPTSWVGLGLIIAVWLCFATVVVWWLLPL